MNKISGEPLKLVTPNIGPSYTSSDILWDGPSLEASRRRKGGGV